MFCPSWCPSWCRKSTTHTYEVSVAVRPVAVTSVSSVQSSRQSIDYQTPATSSSQPSASTSSTESVAHVRFYSTDEISLGTVLRSSPSTIYSIAEDVRR